MDDSSATQYSCLSSVASVDWEGYLPARLLLNAVGVVLVIELVIFVLAASMALSMLVNLVRYFNQDNSHSVPPAHCSICHDSGSIDTWVRTGCCHIFHRGCIGEWTNRAGTCPLCRAVI